MHARISALLLLALATLPASAAEHFSNEQILSLMKKVCDWQLALLPTENTSHQDPPVGWIRAPFYDGAMALYNASGDERYLNAMMKIGQENRWDMAKRKGPASGPTAGKPFIRHADDLAIGQLYAELYLIKKDAAMITPLK